MISARDSQRDAIYDAEDSVDPGTRFSSLAAAQRFVDEVIASEYWDRLPERPQVVELGDGRSRRHACAEETWFGARVKLPLWARTPLTVLHELAHTVTSRAAESHGPEFAAQYLRLVRRFLSEEHWSRLRAAFEQRGVVVAAPPKGKGRILRLVQELQALAAGTDSPAESASAAAKAQDLLLRHNLSTAEVAASQDESDLIERKQPFPGQRRRIAGWRMLLVQVVAESCLCEWMTSFYSEPGDRTFSFIGRSANVEVAVYSFDCLQRQIEELGEKEKQRRRACGQPVRRHLSDFFEGVVEEIRDRLRQERSQFVASNVAGREVLVVRHREAELLRKQLYPHVTFHTSTHYVDGAARQEGRRAGANVQLRQALGGDGQPQRLLGRPRS